MKPAVGLVRKRRFLLVPVLLALAFHLLFRLEGPRQIEYAAYDASMRWKPSSDASGNVVLVFIGDETLRMLGSWPLSREYYAAFNSIMKESGARVVAYDILFVDPSGDPAADRSFAQALRESGNTVLPFFVTGMDVRRRTPPEAMKTVLPLPAFRKNIAGSGFINCPPDSDGVIRRYPVQVRTEEGMLPSFGLVVLDAYYGGRNPEGNASLAASIPADRKGEVLLTFQEDLRRLPNYAFVEVLQSYLREKRGQPPLVPPGAFRDKIVIVGSTAHGIADTGSVPSIPSYLKVGVHCSFLENHFQRRFVRTAPVAVNAGLPLVSSLLLAWTLPALSPWAGLLALLLLAGSVVMVCARLLVAGFLWVEMTPALVTLVLTYVAFAVYQFVGERREKQRIRRIFEKYASPSVLEKILSSPGEIALGGERRSVSILFADVRGFTPIAERLSPEKTVELLNRLFDVMVDAVFRHGGTLDKFMGDAVMAIYGAPVAEQAHAEKAVQTAVEMVRRLKQTAIPGERDVSIGVGIHSGPAVVGNIGSERRMEYTAIGDTVNVAARIQTFAQPGEVLISEETYLLVKDRIACDGIGPRQLKGKGEPVNLYRVRTEVENASTS